MGTADGGPTRRIAVLRITGMTCGACSSTVERALLMHPGVHEASVSCVTHLAKVAFDVSLVGEAAALLEVVDDVGFDAAVLEESGSPDARTGGAGASGRWAVELKIRGMTCTACSGTIERHLQSLKGVDRATVSLVLSKAFVVFDPAEQSAEKLQGEVDDVGFDADVVCSGPADASGSAGGTHTGLHVQVSQLSAESPPTVLGRLTGADGDFAARARKLPGVSGCQRASGNWRVMYDPNQIGARRLLSRLQDELAPDFSVEWVSVRPENEQIESLMREMRSLRRSMLLAMPPAILMFTSTIVLPSFGMDLGESGCLSYSIRHSVDIYILLILVLSTPVQFVVARRFHAAAFKAIKRKSPNMDVLVSVATNTSYFYSTGLVLYCLLMPETPGTHDLVMATSHFFTMGPILIAVVLLGKYLESRAKQTAMKALTDLPSSMPANATLCSSGSNAERTIPVELVELDDVLRIFAGGKIPVDGSVCSESAVHVDESLLTGESSPLVKKQGDLVVGGSTCISGGCLMRVTRVGGDTMLGQMVALVQEAQASKADVQRMADMVARIFVPSVVGLSLVTFLIWSALVFSGTVRVPQGHHMHGGMGGGVMTVEEEVQDSLKFLFAMKFGMAVLMIACPCAMGLATPMAVMVATAVAAKRGCLVKSAAAFETAAKLHAIVLDKTGTITQGSPSIQAAVLSADGMAPLLEAWRQLRKAVPPKVVGQATPREVVVRAPAVTVVGARPQEVEQELQACFWWLLGTLESASDHPVAKCILGTVGALPGLPPIAPPHDFEYFSGRGVRCTVDSLGGVSARVGNLRFYEETVAGRQECGAVSELRSWVALLQEQGHTVVLMHVDAQLVGAVALRDPIREDAAWVVDYLQRTLGLEVWMCTGDNAATAQMIAREVGITNVVAEALPATKSDCVKQLQRTGAGKSLRRVCFVGDGINDSIALAQADVGIAIGVGAQVAVEAADVTLVRSELVDCVYFLSLSKSTFSTIILNFFWAFCFNFVCLPMAAGVFYPTIHIPPLVAGIGMASSSCLVVMTSLGLRRFQPPRSSLSTGSGNGKVAGGFGRRAAKGVEQESLMSAMPSPECSPPPAAQAFGRVFEEP
mmetsp:Transcript_121787/g.389400  ORF Transcript_121787/g.389400 Transcript_121787/m.389400 type:complete len:1102 (+) Transcript_121787:80-3385(+)